MSLLSLLLLLNDIDDDAIVLSAALISDFNNIPAFTGVGGPVVNFFPAVVWVPAVVSSYAIVVILTGYLLLVLLLLLVSLPLLASKL